jgi:hypothetical protein
MKTETLRVIAQYHAKYAANMLQAAALMNAPSSTDFRAQANQHADWALDLEEHATALETFRPTGLTTNEQQPSVH